MLAVLPLGMIGPWQIVVIVLLVVLLFGGKKIPELMRGMGRGMKEFKDAMSKDYSSDGLGLEDDDPVPPAKTAPRKTTGAKPQAKAKSKAKSAE